MFSVVCVVVDIGIRDRIVLNDTLTSTHTHYLLSLAVHLACFCFITITVLVLVCVRSSGDTCASYIYEDL